MNAYPLNLDADFQQYFCLQVLMDPVCCLTCYPQLLNSFVYKTTTLNEAFGSLEGLANAVRIIFSRDLIIAEVILHIFLGRVFHCAYLSGAILAILQFQLQSKN